MNSNQRDPSSKILPLEGDDEVGIDNVVAEEVTIDRGLEIGIRNAVKVDDEQEEVGEHICLLRL